MLRPPPFVLRRSIEAVEAFGASRAGHLPGLSLLARAAQNRLAPALAHAAYRPGEHDVGGIRIIIPATDGIGGEPYMVLGLYERSEIRYLQRRLEPGGGIVDVGAHIGYLSLHAAAAVGPNGFVLAVEPTPESVAVLRRAVTANGFDERVQVVEAAVSDHSGVGALFSSSVSPMMNTLDALDDGQYDRYDVRLTTLDELLGEAEWPRIDLIKIDVEGHERTVLRGAEQTLERYPDVEIMFELQGGKPSLLAGSEETIDHFVELGFRLHRLTPRGMLLHSTPDELRERIRMPRWQDSLFNVIASRVVPPAAVTAQR